MVAVKTNRQWRLSTRPVGLIKESDFQWREEPAPNPFKGEVLVRNVYLSLDPSDRGWVCDRHAYFQPIAVGDLMRGITIGVVEQSRHPDFKRGTFVQGMLGWQDYALSNGSDLTILPKRNGTPLTAHLSVFGHIGLTAYFGLLEVGKPKAGETLVVSAAAGAVGSLAGQIGKILGCRVIGIAGGAEKCRWITEELGFDAAVDYKAESVLEGLKKHCPNGIDVYFENVGGQTLDDVLSLINLKARVVVCGLISEYNAVEPVPGPYNFMNVLIKRACIEGFVVRDFIDRAPEALIDLHKWYDEGRLKYRVEVVDGLDNAVRAVNKLFDGSNQGKLIVKISDDPSEPAAAEKTNGHAGEASAKSG
jgi:NADPH-dependent curcumin reductase